jgi:hypothetical protein
MAKFVGVEAGDRADWEWAFQKWLDYDGLNQPIWVAGLDGKFAIDLQAD